MSTATLSPPRVLPTDLSTVAEFEQWQQQSGNDGNFEFVRGKIIPKSMKQDELDMADFFSPPIYANSPIPAKPRTLLRVGLVCRQQTKACSWPGLLYC